MKKYITQLFLSISVVAIGLVGTGIAGDGISKFEKKQIKNVIEFVEDRADEFKDNFDESLDNSQIDGTQVEDDLNSLVKKFEKATNKLEDKFDTDDDLIESKHYMINVMEAATAINKIMRCYKLSAEAEASWVRTRTELNDLSKVYGIPKVGSKSYHRAL